MKSYGWAIVILILLASCTQEKPNQKTNDQPLVESITQSAVDSITTDPIPVGANQETFEDKPGLVRAIVNNGPAICPSVRFHIPQKFHAQIYYYAYFIVNRIFSALSFWLQCLIYFMSSVAQVLKLIGFCQDPLFAKFIAMFKGWI